MNRRTVTATYKVPRTEFDSSEFSDTAEVVDLSSLGYYIVIDEYVFTEWGEPEDGYLTDADGAPLNEPDLLRHTHLLTLAFGWEED